MNSFKLVKMTLIFLLVVFILPIGTVAGYHYLKTVLASAYDPETMPLNYEIIGAGEKKVVLIHGLVGSKNYWKRDLENITGTHKLLLMDLLGFGDSPKPNSNYSLDIQVEALEKILIKEGYNKGQTVLVGHSLGAILTFTLLAKHPDWFEGVVVIGLPVFTSKKQFRQEMLSHSRFDRLAVSRYGKFICMLRPLYMLKWFKPDNLTDDVFSDAIKHTWQSYSYSLNDIILKAQLYAITGNIKDKKILFFQGEIDNAAPVANVKKFAESFTSATFIEVKGGDHQLFLKDPGKVWNLINEFT